MANVNATTPQLKAVEQYFEAVRTLDMDNAAPFLSKDFIHRSFPKIAEMPDQTKEEHIVFFGLVFSKVAKLDHILHETIEAPGKVVLQWSGICTPIGGTTFDYDSLSIFTLVEEDGAFKILDFKDFADPEKRSNFQKAMCQGGQIA